MKYSKLFTIAIVLLAVIGDIQLSSAKDLPGAAETSYGVGSSGAFNFSIPIVVPEGTNGMHPNLNIGFSSARGNGSLGVGWGLSGLGDPLQ